MSGPKKLSVRHVIDLLHAGPEVARKMGQEEQMWDGAPDALAALDEVVQRLDAVGCDGLALLRSDVRLWSTLNLYEDWKAGLLNPHRNLKQRFVFRIFASPHNWQAGGLVELAERMIERDRPILLELAKCEVKISCEEFSFGLRASYEQESVKHVAPGFLRLLLNELRMFELVDCVIDRDLYVVNQIKFRPNPHKPEKDSKKDRT